MAPQLLISILGGGEWSALRPYRFTPTETAPSTHRIGGWVGHSRSRSYGEKYLAPAGNRIPTPQLSSP
jgi:hypothetical protein